jgi:uncharacterized MnhB-related membrane protein
MTVFRLILLISLIVCSISACISKNTLTSIIIFMAYSLIMSIVWVILESPDLAITEASVGAGVTSVLFFITLRKLHLIKADKDKKDNDNNEE